MTLTLAAAGSATAVVRASRASRRAALGLLALAAASSAPPPASAQQRASAAAMFRGGPSHAGVYEGGGSTLVGLAWRVPTSGDVVSSPAIAGGVVYVGSNDGSLYAFDLATGDRRWRADLGSPVASSPAVGGGLVYAAGRDGALTAVDVATGARRWRVTTRPVAPFPWGHESGDYFVSSPAYVSGTVLFGAGDGGVYAVDARSGAVRWRAQTGGRVRSSPAVDGGRVYVGAFDGRVYCLDLATGAVRWRYDTEGASLKSGDYGFDRRSIQSSPAVAGGTVYVGARDGFLYAIDAASGALRWRYDHKISWVITSPAVDGGVVYAGSSDGHFAQAVDAATGKELWRATTDATVWSSPAVAGDVVYYGDGAGRVHAVDRRTGTERWAFRTGAMVYASPAVSGEYVVVGSMDGSVYALHAQNGARPVKRAVFFDSAYLALARVERPEATARYLVERGYQALDSAALGAFLAERVADRAPSVVVFTIDFAPSSVAGGDSVAARSSLLRRYLEAGGKVVWTGMPPGIIPRTMPPGQLRLDWATPAALSGVPHDSALFDRRGVRATNEGVRWGLPARWRAAWSVAPGGVTQVLGVDDAGLAAAWVRRFGGAEGTGFVRVPGDDPLVVYLTAEHRGGR
ncbi:MAG TPA: PQQ-binding-like beta-propeller repeat protein [Gemmatimonadaceae bacterium]|nr:PQQ-binding-like beta-propeller repeat protein [Gemmatimonadaceae bacterium]